MPKKARIDLGYTHLFVKDAKIDNSQGSSVIIPITQGQSKTSVNIIGAQLTLNV